MSRGPRRAFVLTGLLAALLFGPGGFASPDSPEEVLVAHGKEVTPPGEQGIDVLVFEIDDDIKAGDDLALIDKLTTSWSRTVRASAAMALGGFRTPAALDALTHALSNPNEWIRAGSIGALSFAGGEQAAEALEHLVPAPDDAFADMLPSALARVTPGDAVEFITLSKGTGSARMESGGASAETQEAWNALWSSHRPDESVPEVDFANERVLAFFGGTTSTTTAVEILGVERKSDFLRVLVQRDKSDTPGTAASFHFVRLEQSDLPPHWVQILSPAQ